jgi:ribosomal protein S27E
MARSQADPSHRAERTCESALLVKCPKCEASSIFFRTAFPHIDTCGFESYSFRCESCGSAIAGIINPLDDELLVSLLEDMKAIRAEGS